MWPVLHANAGFKWVSYSDRDGTFVGAYRHEGGVRMNQSWLLPDGKTRVEEHDVLPDGTWKLVKEDHNTYDPRTRPFYKLAADAQDGVWTSPYVFTECIPGITYAVAQRKDNEVAGVFTIDFDLAGLSELARKLQFSEHGRVAITDQAGIVLAHPTEPVVKTVGSQADLVTIGDVADPAK